MATAEAKRRASRKLPAGDLLWVWFDGESPDLPDGWIVAQHRHHGDVGETVLDLVEVLAIYPPLDHPERSKANPRLDASRFRVAANHFARYQGQERNLPVWTAAAGKGTL